MKSLWESLLVIVLVAAGLILQETMHVSALATVLALLGVVAAIATYVACDYAFGRRFARRFPWLFHIESADGLSTMSDAEKAVPPGTFVYLITPDLYNDALNPFTISVVTENLKRGVQYRYVTPKTEAADINISLTKRNFAAFASQIRFYEIDDLFSKLPLSSNILILENPHGDGVPEAYLELPFEQKRRRLFWCKTDDLTARRWHSMLVRLIEQHEPVKFPSELNKGTVANKPNEAGSASVPAISG